MPGAFTAGIERPAEICTPGADGDHIRRAPVFNLINGEFPFAYQGKTFPADIHRQDSATNRQPDLPVGIVQFNIKLVSLKAPVIRQGHAHQTVADIAGNIPAVEHQHVIRRQRTACIKCQRIQHYPAPVIPVNLVAILPALPMSDSACLPISP
ncbi:hypothetical protein C3992_04167 [Escherichia coli]|nr:hypothetical protein C3992_04167 [Escherichia coli]